jgi:hypothetical protein
MSFLDQKSPKEDSSNPREHKIPRKGQFVKGHKKLGGRKKGSKNRVTADLRQQTLDAAAELGGKEGIKGFVKMAGRAKSDALLAIISKLIPRAQLPMDGAIPDSGDKIETITVVGVPPGARIDPVTDEIIYPDGVRPASVPYAPFISTPEPPAVELSERNEQLEREVGALRQRNQYLEWVLDGSRPPPALPGSKPQLIVDNNGEAAAAEAPALARVYNPATGGPPPSSAPAPEYRGPVWDAHSLKRLDE